MIASDVAARGLDIAGLSHVFNFDVPTMPKIMFIELAALAVLENLAVPLPSPQAKTITNM